MDIHDLFQNFRINDAHHKAGYAEGVAKNANAEIKILNEKVDSLSLAVLALIEMLGDVGFTKEMILKKIESIDLRDGKLDGKLQRENRCNNCGRVVAGRHTHCIYCGEPVPNII